MLKSSPGFNGERERERERWYTPAEMVYPSIIELYCKKDTYTEHAKRKTVSAMNVVRLLRTSIIQNGPY